MSATGEVASKRTVVAEGAPAAGRWLARVMIAALAAIGALGVAWGAGWIVPVDGVEPRHLRGAITGGAVLAAAGLAALLAMPRIEPRLARAMGSLSVYVDLLTPRVRALDLFVVSFLSLFLEVLLIRWHASTIVAASYFKNVTLLAAFLGLGLGFAATGRPRLALAVCPVVLAVQVVLLSVADATGLGGLLRHPGGEWLWGVAQAEYDWAAGAGRQTRFWLSAGTFYGFFVALFVSTIAVFVPLGQLTGRLMQGFTPIRAYTINILGSLAGVIGFGVVSLLWLPPVIWFAAVGVLMIVAARHERVSAGVAGACIIVALGAVGLRAGRGAMDVYSPYQRLEVEREQVRSADGGALDTGVLISANKAYHLRTVNLASDFVAAHGERFPRLRAMQAAYDVPYRFVAAPGRVLVVGAGGGNDVAAALRAGAGRVDAVEIDPAIVWLGRRHHAERPYDDPRVAVHVDDARAFMRRAAPGSYDLIVFGLLDSHTLLSGMTAVRLDNFIYTRESFAQARRLLKPGGVMALSFATGAGGYLATRLHDMLSSEFGAPPRCVRLGYDDGLMFVSVSGPESVAGSVGWASGGDGPAETGIERVAGVAPATDDWPFLYLHGPAWGEIPRSYLVMLGMLGVIAVAWVLGGSGRSTGFSPHFFFLGGAFLLIETKGITELALLFGATWVVSSVVIAAILALILLANLCVTLWPSQRRGVHYAALGACLLTGYAIPLERWLALGWWPAAVGATALLVVPLFFAGVIFATSLREAASLPRVFSSNLLGAILGGLCEYASMAMGFRNLYLVGLGLYALSFLTMPRQAGAVRTRGMDAAPDVRIPPTGGARGEGP